MTTFMLFTPLFAGSNPPQKEGVELIITTHSGAQHSGRLLWAGDSALALWKGSLPYDREQVKQYAFPLRVSEMERLTIVQKSQFWTGAGVGLLFGGGAGVLLGFISGDDPEDQMMAMSAGEKALAGFIVLGGSSAIIGGLIGAGQGADDHIRIQGNHQKFKELLPTLRKKAVFPAQCPEELQILFHGESKLLHQSVGEPLVDATGAELSDVSIDSAHQAGKPVFVPRNARFHLFFGGGWIITSANNDISDAFNESGFGGQENGWFGPIYYPIDNSSPLGWRLSADYSISGHWRLGLEWGRIAEQEISGKYSAEEWANRSSLALCLHYLPSPVGILFLHRWEFAVSGGVSYNWLSVKGAVNQFGPQASRFEVAESAIGGRLRFSMDYYLSREFSLGVKIDGELIPVMTVPEVIQTMPGYPEPETRTLQQHSVDFSSLNFIAGIRLHL